MPHHSHTWVCYMMGCVKHTTDRSGNILYYFSTQGTSLFFEADSWGLLSLALKLPPLGLKNASISRRTETFRPCAACRPGMQSEFTGHARESGASDMNFSSKFTARACMQPACSLHLAHCGQQLRLSHLLQSVCASVALAR